MTREDQIELMKECCLDAYESIVIHHWLEHTDHDVFTIAAAFFQYRARQRDAEVVQKEKE